MTLHPRSRRQESSGLGLWLCTLLTALLGAAAAHAETVVIPLGQQGKAWQVETPRKGITKAAVEAQYGAPSTRGAPVGDPPITKWDYEQFTVYFEYDHVVHSVVKFDPANPESQIE